MHLSAQNLVPNPGFEQFLSNPTYSGSGVNEAPGWSTLEHTTDFFHAQYASSFSVPDNFRGYQEPASGEGYAGIRSFGNNASGNEFLVAKLNEPLETDQIYDLAFEVNLSDESRYGVDGIGAVILHEEPTQRQTNLGEYEYVLRNDYGRAISDTVQWTKIEGQFRADGSEQYLIIASLFHETPITFSDIIDPNIPWAYYYIDNVYLAPCPKPIITEVALDTALCKGQSIVLKGLADAKNHHWHQGGVRQTRTVMEDGLFVLDNHYDCKVIQQFFRVSFEDCDCNIRIPTLYSHANNFHMSVSPIVLSWNLQMYDGWGRLVLATDATKGLDPTLIPAMSAPYFWVAQLACLDPEENKFINSVSGKLIIQN